MAKNLSPENIERALELSSDMRVLYTAGLKDVSVEFNDDGSPVLMTEVMLPDETEAVMAALGQPND